MPEVWRKANVTVNLKKGKKESPGNYKSVSIISIPREVMEQLILEIISRHIKDNKIVRMHGFTKAKSCLTNLINFYNEMTGLVDEGRAVYVVYLNFDTVSIRSSQTN